MRYVCLFTLMLPALSAQDGPAIYKERCASCHDSPQPRVPSLTTIKAMSGEAIYLALTSGAMKTRAEGLSTGQIFALLAYIAPTGGSHSAAATIAPTCKGDSTFRADANSPQWNGWSTSATNSRFQDAASAGLAVSALPKLKLKWAFNLGDVATARSQPTVVGGRVFIGSQTGAVYALDADTGCTRWAFQAAGGIRSGVTLGESNNKPAVFFGDEGATMYALNAQTGELLWKLRPVDHYATLATATPRYYKGVVYQPFASFEEALGGDPKFQCCTFRGSVAALDAGTGKKIWQTFTISETPKATRKTPVGTQQFGPSGASVWSSATIDEQLGVLYVATGDNYSDPPTNTSDAILAMELKTGELLWSKQLTENDAFNNGCVTPQRTNCPEAGGPDYDFGQPPILVHLRDGKRALVIAQKSGMVHALDPDQKGKILWQTRAGKGGAFGAANGAPRQTGKRSMWRFPMSWLAAKRIQNRQWAFDSLWIRK
jgi:polyvinyl alcohol dehydrogenase (cytochrome)